MANLSIEFDRDDLARLLKRLGRARALDTLRGPMTRGLARLQRDLASYPPPSRKPQPAKSRRQQIKQIMLAKEGKIPYRRTGQLGRAWTAVIDDGGDGLEGVVGNATSYGPLVQGDAEQAGYHRGVWQTDQDVLERHRAGIIDDFADELDRALGK